MTAVSRGPVPALLLRTGIIAAVLAMIAGIFGMHVMTANHTMHSPAAAQLAATLTSPGDGHTGHQGGADDGVPGSTQEAAGKPVPVGLGAGAAAACACSAGCAGAETGAACVPLAKGGTLAAPEAGQGTVATRNRRGLPDRMSVTYSTLSGSPSPGELSISRT
ncbi:hypothetical protein [Arthrobacter oryzae]|uniref:hypothetical protein n=1 Tax=Arthrobacter oryzae TaxID=409290 RepID=UPI002865C302|nr:hypothetical protein [Arthrobacter oryzae]MDR6505671.1 Spy/CpxP family protein refolding chaperone [Arthrobacter oryzae]